MGLSHSPRIITDGLVLCVDAANKRSYPGTGTTWTDLASGSNGTLTNGPTFGSDNGGSLVFDGTNDYVELGNDSSFDITQTLTLECWAKKTTKNNYHHLISKFPSSQCSYMLGTIKTSGYVLFQKSTTGADQGLSGTFAVDVCDGNWYHIIASYNSLTSTLIMSINNKIQTTSLSGDIYVTATDVNIAKRTGVGQYFPSNISNVRIYNKALTVDEILQNYNATRGRFQ
jgi:hypothetical protein